ncbi:hypothetical protein C0991_008217 [Blastosporella zonata]|nr:hypothetical protein C0991_008217 [Blastosporella zonata]
MRRFLVGDDLGNIKSVSYSLAATQDGVKTTTKTLSTGSSKAVQVLAVDSSSEQAQTRLLAAGFSSGLASIFSIPNSDADPMEEVYQWKETRLKDGHAYIGLEISEKGAFSCTSNGALRLTSFNGEGESPSSQLASLPNRLHAWRMSGRQDTFVYGGDEVDVSLWDAERAFTPQYMPSGPEVKKRKRDALFPGELWRAKNVQNDDLGLRQPLRITSLTYLSPSSASHHLAAGTELGNIRRYDTRAARRPVSDWKVAKIGGIRELFASDNGSNLYAVDLRNGKVAYGYPGISGAIVSSAPSPSFLASASLDRYVRIHSTFSPPPKVGQQQEQKGAVLDKIFMKSTPTVIVWDHAVTQESTVSTQDDDVWETMATTGVDSDDDSTRRRKRIG